ncbi:hypothetical protein OUZ56_031959 [Daphnia magna]|uniref:Sushi domain-containing protein n=1 Tax=Daphnia magna TaxID=35525 RepID=A0ABQ9ZVQ6_9CRUS|nr:hypothetical protein OUZ56_031959 [Daphnia magna]
MFVLWSGLLVQFRCQSAEYKLVGAAAVICRNRTWTQDPPVCVHQHQLQLHLQQQQSIGDDVEQAEPSSLCIINKLRGQQQEHLKTKSFHSDDVSLYFSFRLQQDEKELDKNGRIH